MTPYLTLAIVDAIISTDAPGWWRHIWIISAFVSILFEVQDRKRRGV